MYKLLQRLLRKSHQMGQEAQQNSGVAELEGNDACFIAHL
uniref:Transcriptional regulator n=1 Tax=Ascaris lumbricoides TaxID=6252 RepID=A0A0M3HV59_ASCLU